MKRFYFQLILFSLLVFFAASLPAAAFAQPEIREKRQELKDRVERFRQVRQEATETEEKLSAPSSTEAKLSSLELQKDVLLRAIDSLAKHAELLQRRLEHFPLAGDELQTSLDAEISTDIAQLEEFRLQVQNTTSIEELREIANALKTHRKDTIEEKIRRMMLLAQVELFEQRVLETASARANRIQENLDEFSSTGADVEALKTSLGDAQAKILAASGTLVLLKKNVRSEEIDEIFIQDARDVLKRVATTIRETYETFRSIARETKNL